MKKKNDKRFYIATLFVMILSLAVGYALFAEALNITGTATTSGTFDVEFSATSVTEQNLQSNASSVIAGDGNSITITADFLQPGDDCTISVTVQNVGNINANLESVDVTGNTDPDMVITLPTWPTGVSLSPLATYQFDITVEWDSLSSTWGKNVEFTIDLNYEQEV